MFGASPGNGHEGLGSHEKEEYDEGADHVGVEHFISDLRELDQRKLSILVIAEIFLANFQG